MQTMPDKNSGGDVFELYEQLTPTRLYASQKTHTATTGEVMCRLCYKRNS